MSRLVKFEDNAIDYVAVEYDETYRVVSWDLSEQEIEEIKSKFEAGTLSEFDFDGEEEETGDLYSKLGFEVLA